MTLTFAMPSKENSVDLKNLPEKKPVKKLTAKKPTKPRRYSWTF